jgi:molybdopterin converting factor small subunit
MKVAATPALRVRVLLFASYADTAGAGEMELTVPAPASVADVVRQVRVSFAGGDRIPPRPLVARNRVHASLDEAVSDGDEVAILPPMAGG